ncbi:hypothetical protein XENORESO_008970 [Xenotaenia resolanae]|uniref:Secreted protein n=1 Tax=Xenotaenia resolanae TaxID=208358 RepID=A0ABV0X5H6_9TELE
MTDWLTALSLSLYRLLLSEVPHFTQTQDQKNITNGCPCSAAIFPYLLCAMNATDCILYSFAHIQKSAGKAKNVLCSFTASLFVGHAQGWLAVSAPPTHPPSLYTPMHSLKHPHLHKVCELLYLSNGLGNY